VVEYIYNTWGKKVTTTGSLAGTLGLIQPFRYRGYVYDWETGFYYLQSRYYDPTTGRFISSDVLLSTGQGVLGHNAYAYCLDNPVNMVDDGGTRPAKGAINPDGDGKGDIIDEDNRIIRYNVPLFSQGTTSLCWAYCQIMDLAYRYYYEMTQDSADAIARVLDFYVMLGKPADEKDNHGSYPQNIIGRTTVTDISCDTLYDLLIEHGPLYGFYETEAGHYIVITGVDVTNSIVYTNNPWGVKGEQSLEEFKNGFVNMQGVTVCKGNLKTISWSK